MCGVERGVLRLLLVIGEVHASASVIVAYCVFVMAVAEQLLGVAVGRVVGPDVPG